MKITSKKGILLRDVIIAAILAMGLVALFTLAVGAMTSNYDREDVINPAFSANYNKLDSLLTDLDNTRKEVTSPSGLNLIGAFNIAFNSIITAFKLVLTSLDMFANMAASVVSDYTFLNAGVVKVLMGVLLASLLVTILFVWLSSVTRGRI